MEKYFSFAGLELAVSAKDEWMQADDRTLAPFRVNAVTDPHRFTFTIVDQLTAPAGNQVAVMDDLVIYRDGDIQLRYHRPAGGDWATASMRILSQGKTHNVELKREVYHKVMVSPKVILNAVMAEHLIVQENGFLFHSSYIDVGGRAILFTAPSGTGKSTQADLWHTLRGAKILNGDRSAVCCTENGIYAFGVPFLGSSQYGENVTLPLAGIVYLEQASHTTIRRLRGVEAFRRVWEGISADTWDKEDISKLMDTVMQVTSMIPVWHLACTPDESAVVALEQQLRK